MKHSSYIIGAAALGLFALPAIAQAHDAGAVPACDQVAITGTNFLPGPNLVHVRVTSDGALVLERDVEISNDVATPVKFDTALVGGPHQVSVELSWTLSDDVQEPYVAGAAAVTCPPAEPPPTTTTTTTAPGPAANVTTNVTTNAPTTTAPRVTPLPRKRNSNITCAQLLKAGAGARWIELYDCPKPDRCPRLLAAIDDGAGPKWVQVAIDRGCITVRVPVSRMGFTG